MLKAIATHPAKVFRWLGRNMTPSMSGYRSDHSTAVARKTPDRGSALASRCTDKKVQSPRSNTPDPTSVGGQDSIERFHMHPEVVLLFTTFGQGPIEILEPHKFLNVSTIGIIGVSVMAAQFIEALAPPTATRGLREFVGHRSRRFEGCPEFKIRELCFSQGQERQLVILDQGQEA